MTGTQSGNRPTRVERILPEGADALGSPTGRLLARFRPSVGVAAVSGVLGVGINLLLGLVRRSVLSASALSVSYVDTGTLAPADRRSLFEFCISLPSLDDIFVVLDDIEVPRGRVRIYGMSAEIIWRDIFDLLDHGIVENGFPRLLSALSGRYPGSAILAELQYAKYGRKSLL